MDLTTNDTLSLSTPLASPGDTCRGNFWVALACALAAHALFLAAIASRPPHKRFVGAEAGSDGAIAVEIVTKADFDSRETVKMASSGGAVLKPTLEPPAHPPQDVTAATARPARTDPAPPPHGARESEGAAERPNTPLVPDLADLPLPDVAAVVPSAKKEPRAEKSAKPEPSTKEAKPQNQPRPKQAKLNLASPPSAPLTGVGPGRAAGASRPPGITRSGENDEFGRNVIRALRATMPPHSGIFGRVTVKLLLNANGDLVEVRVLEPSGKPNLDRSVVFSAKQAYFPLPPARSTELDRTFIVSYVYR